MALEIGIRGEGYGYAFGAGSTSCPLVEDLCAFRQDTFTPFVATWAKQLPSIPGGQLDPSKKKIFLSFFFYFQLRVGMRP